MNPPTPAREHASGSHIRGAALFPLAPKNTYEGPLEKEQETSMADRKIITGRTLVTAQCYKTAPCKAAGQWEREDRLPVQSPPRRRCEAVPGSQSKGGAAAGGGGLLLFAAHCTYCPKRKPRQQVASSPASAERAGALGAVSTAAHAEQN